MKRALNTLFLDRQGVKAITGISTEDLDHDKVQNPFPPSPSMERALNSLSLDRQVTKTLRWCTKVQSEPAAGAEGCEEDAAGGRPGGAPTNDGARGLVVRL